MHAVVSIVLFCKFYLSRAGDVIDKNAIAIQVAYYYVSCEIVIKLNSSIEEHLIELVFNSLHPNAVELEIKNNNRKTESDVLDLLHLCTSKLVVTS